MKKPHLKVVVKDGIAMWDCNGWIADEPWGAFFLWWYDGDYGPEAK